MEDMKASYREALDASPRLAEIRHCFECSMSKAHNLRLLSAIYALLSIPAKLDLYITFWSDRSSIVVTTNISTPTV